MVSIDDVDVDTGKIERIMFPCADLDLAIQKRIELEKAIYKEFSPTR